MKPNNNELKEKQSKLKKKRHKKSTFPFKTYFFPKPRRNKKEMQPRCPSIETTKIISIIYSPSLVELVIDSYIT